MIGTKIPNGGTRKVTVVVTRSASTSSDDLEVLRKWAYLKIAATDKSTLRPTHAAYVTRAVSQGCVGVVLHPRISS